AAVHEPLVVRLVRGAAAGRESLVDEIVDRLTAVGAQREDGLGARLRVGDLLLGEPLEELVGEEHGVAVALVDDEAGGVLIREARVERKTEPGEEVDGPLEVLDGEIDKDLR